MLVIIPCGQRKQTVTCAAGEMYTGPYHRACRRYADMLLAQGGGSILILSALHGLLLFSDRIAPYNLHMGQPGSVTALLVRQQAEKRGMLLEDRVIALGGAGYRKVCQGVWPHCETPLAGKGGIGKQLGWLKRETERLQHVPT